MLCSILLLSLGFNVLTDYFYWGASSCQQTETLTPKGFFPKFLSEYIRYTECALWSIFSIQISPLSNNLCFRPFRLTLLYHGIRYRTSVLFIFVQFISHLQRKEKHLNEKLNSGFGPPDNPQLEFSFSFKWLCDDTKDAFKVCI